MESRRPRLVASRVVCCRCSWSFSRRSSWLLVVTTTTIRGNGGGGGGAETQESESKVANFAIVTPEKGSDYGWNQQSIEAARKIATDRGIEVNVADNSGYEDVTPILRELVDRRRRIHHRPGERVQHGGAGRLDYRRRFRA